MEKITPSPVLPSPDSSSQTATTVATSEIISQPILSPPDANPGWGKFWWLACAWTLIIVLVWLALHPLFNVEFPIAPANAGALLSFGLDLALLALCVVGSAAVGDWLLELVGVCELVGLERTLFNLGLGLGVNIGLILGLGVTVGINWPVGYGLLAIELGLAVGRWRRRTPTVIGQSRRQLLAWWQEAPWWERGLAIWCSVVALATLLLALTPPIAWDALMYHLEGPKRYIEVGRIEELPRLGQASFPFGAEMLFTWGLLLHGEGLAQAFSWLYGGLGALACLSWGRHFWGQTDSRRGRQLGLLAAALYLSVPHVWLLMTWAYTDTMLTFYALLAFQALLWAVRAESSRVAVGYAGLGGIMGGLSCGGKYTAALAVFGALGGALLVGVLGQQSRPAYRRLSLIGLVFGLAALASFAPWLIRNIVFSGNPVAPLFGGIRGWSADEIAALAGQDGGVALTPQVVLGRPVAMVLNGHSGGLYDATISPLFLALLPLSVRAAFRNRIVAGMWLAIGLNYLGWLVGIKLSAAADHTRIILPVFPLLALVTAYGLLDWAASVKVGSARLLGVISKGAVGLFLVVSSFLLLLTFVASDPLPFDLGLQSRADRVEGQLGQYYRAARFVNGNLPPDAKLFMFFEPRAYYFDRTLSYDHNNGGQFFYYASRYPTPQAFHDELLRRGATHVLVNDDLLNFLINVPEYHRVEPARAGRQLLDDLVSQGLFEKIYQETGQYTVYRLR